MVGIKFVNIFAVCGFVYLFVCWFFCKKCINCRPNVINLVLKTCARNVSSHKTAVSPYGWRVAQMLCNGTKYSLQMQRRRKEEEKNVYLCMCGKHASDRSVEKKGISQWNRERSAFQNVKKQNKQISNSLYLVTCDLCATSTNFKMDSLTKKARTHTTRYSHPNQTPVQMFIDLAVRPARSYRNQFTVAQRQNNKQTINNHTNINTPR